MAILIEHKRMWEKVSIIGLENIPRQWLQSQSKTKVPKQFDDLGPTPAILKN